jgi:hypothetical protein
MQSSPTRARVAWTAAVSSAFLVAFVAACTSPAGVASPVATTAVVATAAATTGTVASPPPATSGPVATTKPGPKTPSVDLTFTGTVDFVAKGTKGTCQIGKSSDGSFVFGFYMKDADYPGLGESFQLNEDLASHKVDTKWITPKGNVPFFGIMPTAGVTISADHHSIQLDADLPPSEDKTEHVKGSISCP